MDRDANGSTLRNFIAAAVVAVGLAGAGYLVGRDRPKPAEPMPVSPPPAPVETPEPVVIPDVTLQRADLLRLGEAAADSASGGPAVQDMLDGKRFTIRIPFGCGDLDADATGAFGAHYDADEGTLRVKVQPQDWTQLPWVAAELERREADGAAGFWLPRPWTRNEACPAEGAEVANPVSNLGIVQIFNSASTRVAQRRGRPFEATVQLAPEDANLGKGLRLVIEGRVARWPDSRDTVLCHADGPYQRPSCLVGAEFDRIAIENESSGEQLADWRF